MASNTTLRTCKSVYSGQGQDWFINDGLITGIYNSDPSLTISSHKLTHTTPISSASYNTYALKFNKSGHVTKWVATNICKNVTNITITTTSNFTISDRRCIQLMSDWRKNKDSAASGYYYRAYYIFFVLTCNADLDYNTVYSITSSTIYIDGSSGVYNYQVISAVNQTLSGEGGGYWNAIHIQVGASTMKIMPFYGIPGLSASTKLNVSGIILVRTSK